MLFSAVVNRVFGGKHKRNSLSRRITVTNHAFFKKFPLLHDFLLSELSAICQRIEDSSGGNPIIESSSFPMLLILSKLTPNQTNLGTEDEVRKKTTVFITNYCILGGLEVFLLSVKFFSNEFLSKRPGFFFVAGRLYQSN